MTTTTPTPWRMGKHGNAIVSDAEVFGMDGANEPDYYGGNMVAESVAPQNAALIVHRVNGWDEVVGALESLIDSLSPEAWEALPQYVQDKAMAALTRAKGV